MRPEDRAEIRQLPLFCNMLQANFTALMRAAHAQRFPAGLELIKQGNRADFLHFVVEGSVELFGYSQERSTTMAVVQQMGTFILAASVRDLPYLMSARTLQPSRILLVPTSDIRGAFRHDPEFATSIIGEGAGVFRWMARHAKNLNLRTSRERIAGCMLKQFQLPAAQTDSGCRSKSE